MYKPINQAVFKDATTINRLDTRNQIIIKLLDKDGASKDLTGKTVTWSGRNQNGIVISNRAAQVFAGGEVGIKFLSTDNIKAGALYIQFKVVWSATENEYFPANDKLFLVVT